MGELQEYFRRSLPHRREWGEMHELESRLDLKLVSYQLQPRFFPGGQGSKGGREGQEV